MWVQSSQLDKCLKYTSISSLTLSVDLPAIRIDHDAIPLLPLHRISRAEFVLLTKECRI